MLLANGYIDSILHQLFINNGTFKLNTFHLTWEFESFEPHPNVFTVMLIDHQDGIITFADPKNIYKENELPFIIDSKNESYRMMIINLPSLSSHLLPRLIFLLEIEGKEITTELQQIMFGQDTKVTRIKPSEGWRLVLVPCIYEDEILEDLGAEIPDQDKNNQPP